MSTSSWPRVTAIFLLATVGAMAWAQEWMAVGTGIYIDTKSQQRNGDIGSIVVRDAKTGQGRFEFDCVKRLWLAPKEGAKEIDQWPEGTPLRLTFDAACKRWYEVWK